MEIPTCSVSRRCGACQLSNLTYPEQLAWKQATINRLLGRFAKPRPILGMEHPYHYRNKAQAAFVLNKRRMIVSGVYQSNSNSVIAVNSCMLQDPAADRIIGSVRKLMESFKLLPYNSYTGRGFLRHVLVRRGFASGQIMVVLVSATPIFPGKNNFVRALLAAHPEITTLIHNVNADYEGLMLGRNDKVLFGPGYIEDTLCGCTFRISAHSFYQINPVQTERLYQIALDAAGLTGTETVLDAYCGIGTIGLCAARRAGRVIGVESVGDAVRDATANARRNDIQNATFYRSDAGRFVAELVEAGEHIDVAFLDPPRAGCNPHLLEALTTLAPKRIVYVSCNPETLARDLRALSDYKVNFIQPVDMFPHTNHVETVVLITRAKE